MERTSQRFQGFDATVRSSWEELADFNSHTVGRFNISRADRPRDDIDTVIDAPLCNGRIKGRCDDKFCSRLDGCIGLGNIVHGASTDEESRHMLTHSTDGIQAGIGPECNFCYRHAAIDQCLSKRNSIGCIVNDNEWNKTNFKHHFHIFTNHTISSLFGTFLKFLQLAARRQAFIITGYLDLQSPDGRTAPCRIVQG